MGQNSSQRKVRHQSVELWELYDGENRSGRSARSAQTGREGRRTNQRGNDTLNRRAGGHYRDDGRNDAGRRLASISGQQRAVSGQRTARAADRNRQPDTVVRRSGGTGQNRRPSRPKELSQISYIQPYTGAGQRRRNPEYVYRGNARPVQSIRRRRARRRKELLCKGAIALLTVACFVLIYVITGQIYQLVHRSKPDKEQESLPVIADSWPDDDVKVEPPELIENLLEVNEYSRPGTPLERVNSIFVHYTANPGTSAAQNRSYFANLAETHERSASAHLIIGYEGEVIQCIPFDEQAYAVMTRNEDSISIECCFLSEDGSFTQETYDTLVHTLAWLLEEFHLSTEDILRHYDCGGKLCPLYYAENEDEWERLKQDVAAYAADHG